MGNARVVCVCWGCVLKYWKAEAGSRQPRVERKCSGLNSGRHTAGTGVHASMCLILCLSPDPGKHAHYPGVCGHFERCT